MSTGIIIVGGGLTGATLALAVSQMSNDQIPINLIETMEPNETNHSIFDTRFIALTKGTCQHLARIGIWKVLENRATEISAVHISDCGHSGFFYIDMKDHYLGTLGQVVEVHDVMIHLFHLLKKTPSITLYCPATVAKFNRTEEEVNVILNDNTKINGQLLVAADGLQSSIGTACGITWNQEYYNQAAVIANVSTSISHKGCAFERFTEHGPLAMLPISQGRSALVWCHPLNKIGKILSWSDNHFCNELQKSFGWRLGRITCTEKRSVYPLTLTVASQFISHRIVLVGNAAQTLHPIAAQGFNLAFRDVINLAEVLTQAWNNQKECGTWKVLCTYQSLRKADKEATINLTDGLVRLFSNRWIPLIIVRNVGMMIAELFTPARNVLAQHIFRWIVQ